MVSFRVEISHALYGIVQIYLSVCFHLSIVTLFMYTLFTYVHVPCRMFRRLYAMSRLDAGNQQTCSKASHFLLRFYFHFACGQ